MERHLGEKIDRQTEAIESQNELLRDLIHAVEAPMREKKLALDFLNRRVNA